MTDLEKKLLATVERLEKEFHESEAQFMTHLQEVETRLNSQLIALSLQCNESDKRLAELIDHYNTVVKYLENLG